MTGSLRTSTGPYDGGGGSNSIVEQTTDIIHRFRNSIVRSRKERLLDEHVQAIENILDQLHFTEVITKETLGKLISQGDSMQRSYGLRNQRN
jgi:ATP-dependent Zn protease